MNPGWGGQTPLQRGQACSSPPSSFLQGGGGCGGRGMRGRGAGEVLQRRWTEVQSGDQLPIGQE